MKPTAGNAPANLLTCPERVAHANSLITKKSRPSARDGGSTSNLIRSFLSGNVTTRSQPTAGCPILAAPLRQGWDSSIVHQPDSCGGSMWLFSPMKKEILSRPSGPSLPCICRLENGPLNDCFGMAHQPSTTRTATCSTTPTRCHPEPQAKDLRLFLTLSLSRHSFRIVHNSDAWVSQSLVEAWTPPGKRLCPDCPNQCKLRGDHCTVWPQIHGFNWQLLNVLIALLGNGRAHTSRSSAQSELAERFENIAPS